MVIFTVSGGAALAQNDLITREKVTQYPLQDGANLRIFTPDSPFYFLQQFTEWAQAQLTFNSLERAKYELALMEYRIAEINYLIQRGWLTIESVEVLENVQSYIQNIGAVVTLPNVEAGLGIEELISEIKAMLMRQEEALREFLQETIAHAPETVRNFFQHVTEIIHDIKEWIAQAINLIPLPNFPATPEPVE